MKYIHRATNERLAAALRNFPVVLVVGPRQCGKTTLVREILQGWTHLDLERPSDFYRLASDPEGFFEEFSRDVVIDEAQRMPELFPWLRPVVDGSRKRGRFLLLGSAAPPLLRTASESLAGRIGILELTPFTCAELSGRFSLADRWFWGGYPPLFDRRHAREKHSWYESFVSTFLERDLSEHGLRLDPHRLRKFWSMLAHLHGGILNSSDLARSLDVSVHTVQNYLDILESSFMIRRLAPYHANIGKRLVKSPKLYIRDTGLLHYLLDLTKPQELEVWPRRGQSWEGLVVEELITAAVKPRELTPTAFYWRTQAGAEVDLLLKRGRTITPIEIKSGSTIQPQSLAALRNCMKDLGLKRGVVIYSGKERHRAGRGIEILPFQDVVNHPSLIYSD